MISEDGKRISGIRYREKNREPSGNRQRKMEITVKLSEKRKNVPEKC